jgi:large subunit ribosomal protein L3
MMKGLIGTKLGMTQIFADDGRRIPVTVVKVGPCVVLQKKSVTQDGYNAIQIGFGEKKSYKATKALVGHCSAADKGVFRYLRELRLDKTDQYAVGDELGASVFGVGELVDVTGTSKGKGFQGVVKRWGFKGGRMSHGSCFHRAPGSIGTSATPSRVFKGTKMPGQLGNKRITTQRLQIVRIDVEENLLLIKGAIPGATNGLVLVKDSIKATK